MPTSNRVQNPVQDPNDNSVPEDPSLYPPDMLNFITDPSAGHRRGDVVPVTPPSHNKGRKLPIIDHVQ